MMTLRLIPTLGAVRGGLMMSVGALSSFGAAFTKLLDSCLRRNDNGGKEE